MMLYHASDKAGLNRLMPAISTHGKPYVYAIGSKVMAMLFGAPKDDFDLLIDAEEGKPILFECYPGALKRMYSGKTCSVYQVKADGFLSNVTGWDEEWVNENPVDVEQEEIIGDIYGCILEAAQNGLCQIHEYEDSEAYLRFLRDELQERIEMFGLSEEWMNNDPRFAQYHNRLLKKQI